jgi:hypothetical protein
MAERTETLLDQKELARRWRLSHRTLERWRWLGQGPCFLKIGGRVVYRLEDIRAYEAEGEQKQETIGKMKSS